MQEAPGTWNREGHFALCLQCTFHLFLAVPDALVLMEADAEGEVVHPRAGDAAAWLRSSDWSQVTQACWGSGDLNFSPAT